MEQVTALGCADLDECSLENGGCSDVCVNTVGSFYCECSDALESLSMDGKTCSKRKKFTTVPDLTAVR